MRGQVGATPRAASRQPGADVDEERIRLHILGEGKGDGLLPVAAILPSRRSRPLSRGCAQRLSRRLVIEERAYMSVRALNAMAGFDTPTVKDVGSMT